MLFFFAKGGVEGDGVWC